MFSATAFITLSFGLLSAASPTPSQKRSGTCTRFAGNLTTNPSGPLFPGSFADPDILLYNKTYYGYATNHYAGEKINVPVATSTDFRKGWQPLSNYTDCLPTTGN